MEKDLRIILRICTLLGIHNGKNKGLSEATTSSVNNKSFRQYFNMFHLLYSFGLIVILTTLSGIIISNQKYEQHLKLSWTVATITFVSQIFSYILVLVESIWQSEAHDKFLRKLSEIDESAKLRLKVSVDKQRLFHCIKWSLCALALLSICSSIVFSLTAIVLKVIQYFWFSVLPIITIRWRILQLMAYVQMIHTYLQCLNKKLRQVVAYKMSPEIRFLDVDYKHFEDGVALMLSIKQTHALIYECTCLLDDFTGGSLLSIVACFFLDFTIHTYWIVLIVDGLRTVDGFIPSIAAILPLGIILCTFCWLSEQCKREGQFTNRLINKLCVVSRQRDTKHFNSIVDDFSLQLQHEHIKISAKSIFTFDMHLVMAIFVAIVTHLIILVQFWKSENRST